MQTTRLSAKGQVIRPKSIRDFRVWPLGTEFTVEETDAGLLLRPAARFPATELADVAGCLKVKGGPKSIAQMDAAITHEVGRRHARGRAAVDFENGAAGNQLVRRSLYGFEESAVCDAFTKLLGLKNVCAEDAACVAAAPAPGLFRLTGH